LQVDIAFAGGDRLGECPRWCAAERALYWIDGLAPALRRLDADGRYRIWPMPRPIGSFAFRRRGGLIGAFTGGFATMDVQMGDVQVSDLQPIGPSPSELETAILNDGSCDRRGRFWCGSRASDLVSPAASLFRLDPDGRCRAMDDGFAVSNGIAWSPDNRTMYFADSPTGSIFAYDFDLDSGEIGNRRLFATTTALGGLPDGAAVDSAGCYWSALFGGGVVVRFDPDGRLIGTVPLPVKNPTMCAFGGDRLDVLYVTSARALMNETELARQPLAGAVLAITGLGVEGLAEVTFDG
jgi:sugar lactone lactonase YvrE